MAMAQFFLKAALKGDWEAITTRYREQPALCNDTPVTNITGDTLIHIAVQSGQAEAVAELLDLLPEHVRVAKNNVGNTSLHEAARTGMLIKTARAILKKDASLVSSRNKHGETPVFWAVMHGNKEMLLFLVSDVMKVGEETLRRSDGSTILHVAILGKFYDVALEILEMFPGMALNRDERGITALHLLTLFPSSFKSRGIYSLSAVLDPPNFLRVSIPVVKLLHAAVFACVPVDPYQTSDGSDQGQSRLKNFTETCMDFLRSGMERIFLVAANPKLIIAKEKHTWALQLARLLIKKEAQWRYGHDGRSPREEAQWSYEHDAKCPQRSNGQHQIGEQHQIGNDGDECKERLERPLILATKCGIVKLVEEILKAFPESIEFLDDKRHQIGDDGDEYKERLERPLILATKYGIVELVEEILKAFPESIEFLDDKAGKNLLHLAIEYRQVHVFNLLKKEKRVTTVLAAGIDKNGNTILHLAAKFKKDNSSHVGGPVIQMHQENAWFEAVKELCPAHLVPHKNRSNQTAKQVFTKSHEDLFQEGKTWLKEVSKACMTVSTVMAAVAFAMAFTVASGNKQETELPVLQDHQKYFKIFILLVASSLLSSIFSILGFLSFHFSTNKEIKDFLEIPCQLYVSLFTLLYSLASTISAFVIGFCLVSGISLPLSFSSESFAFST